MSKIDSFKLLCDTVGTRRAVAVSRSELVARAAAAIGGPEWGSALPPSMDDLGRSMPTTTVAEEVLRWAGADDSQVRNLLAEYDGVAEEVQAAYARTATTCPENWAVETATATVLYALVRLRRPDRVIETGIANGHSAFIILSAMAANGTGQLASVDVRHDVGGLVPDDLAERWTKVIVDDRRPDIGTLNRRLGGGNVDIFFHDGDHRLLGQMIDYQLAGKMLNAGGILVSDDINTTAAWVTAKRWDLIGDDGMVLLDRRKAVGFARF
ncbi:class I SAM-dependent methyltransferase [Nocardioides psychrotolerans]|uniref:class I SAM-dependent methyltransferase n=1 Tax=Nocardioides psychrotolerans TaxID=1005945 RepID=UPI0031381020